MSRKGFLWGLGVGLFLIVAIWFHFLIQNSEAQVASNPCAAPAGSAINSITYNPDGSVDAMVQFTNGGGITGVTSVHLPTPAPVVGATIPGFPPNILSPAVPWTNANVMTGITAAAAAAKTNWLQTINGTSPVGATAAF